MARDIEEFLKKAAERRQQQKGGAPQQPRQPQPPPQQPPRRQAPRVQEPMIIDAVESEIIEARPVRRPPQAPPKKPRKQSSIRSESVADHVQNHIDTSDIAQHASGLGERIASVHDKVDARVRQRLDHDLSAIDDKPTVTDDPRPAIFGARNSAAATELHQVMRNPISIRQAILIAEILKRPDI